MAHIDFATDGISLFINELGALVNVSGSGQTAIREALQDHLRRVERDEHGIAEMLFPFTRRSRSASDPKVVVINPRISFGRPVLVETGIPTAILVDRFMAGDSFAELAEEYSCDPLKIEEAIRCEIAEAA